MAVSSLHNISVLGDSPRPVPRQGVVEGTQRSQASTVLQMWRKIEDEHAGRIVEQRTKTLRQLSDEFNDDISTQTSESNCSEQRAYMEEIAAKIACINLSGSETRAHIENHDGEEKSSDIGEAERERVRQIFRDWMNCGGKEHPSNPSQISGSSRDRLLGDNECERVRVVREWVQLTAQDGGSYSNKEGIAKISAEIERVRDGLVLVQHDGRPYGVHRKFRTLGGKQAMIDLIEKAAKQRQCELDDINSCHAVSQFPHRNRIQSLLKGRFLRNNISSEKQKPTSTAAGELGLLRQRQTVSGLREELLSRADSTGLSQLDSANDHASSSSNTVATFTKQSEITITCNNPAKDDQDIPEQSVYVSVADEIGLQSDGNFTVVSEHAIQDIEVSRQEAVCVESTISNNDTVSEEDLQLNMNERRGQHLDEAAGAGTQAVAGLICDSQMYHGSEIHDSSVFMNGSGNAVEDINLQRHTTEDDATHQHDADNEEGRLDRVTINDQSNTIFNGAGIDNPDLLRRSLDESESDNSVEDWIQSSSRQDSGAFGLVEENIRTSELNELIGRRRVSNLLESGFRENLNRLLQTYVERQAQSSISWDVNDTVSTPASEVLHQGQPTDNENDLFVDTFGPSRYSGVPLSIRRQQIGGQDSWGYTMHQPLEFQDWEVVNDLRMDITTLQLRMNDMQRMLEACMDMQLELQRSIRQEVSAALNRSIPPGTVDSVIADNEPKWELVRKGICCVCSDRSIDSLLYRCGHMCTCTKCANELLNEKNKCPMCRSPIVEVIRAYPAQQQ